MGDRRFDADNDEGRPDLGTLRVRELVDRVSGWCRTGALARVRKYDLRGKDRPPYDLGR
jgi:hypothetical protein